MTNILLMLADDMSFGDLFRQPHPAFGAMAKINSRFKTQGTLLQRYMSPGAVVRNPNSSPQPECSMITRRQRRSAL